MKVRRIWRRPEIGLSGRHLALEIVAWAMGFLASAAIAVRNGGLVRITAAAFLLWVATPNLALCLRGVVRHHHRPGE
jgi:hypothetical protein